MGTFRLKPKPLRPQSARDRRWFYGFMFVGLLVIAVGWFITIRGFLDEVPNIKTAIEQGVSQAADEIQEAQLEPPVEVREITKALEDVKAGYEAEKQKQQISPEEESSYE